MKMDSLSKFKDSFRKEEMRAKQSLPTTKP